MSTLGVISSAAQASRSSAQINRSCGGATTSGLTSAPKAGRRTHRRAVVHASFGNCGPNGFGRTGPGGWGNGMMGADDLMKMPVSEALQQIQKDFAAASKRAQAQAQQAQEQAQRAAGQRPRQQPDSSPAASTSYSNAMGLPVDTIETDEAVWYFADLPGMEKKDLQIQANQQNRTITLSGERSQPITGHEDGRQMRDIQRRFGKFSHTIRLPKTADPQLISAKVDKGVLRVKVLKSSEPEGEMQDVRID